MTALSVLARAKLAYQREQGKGKSSDTSHFPGSSQMATEDIRGASEASTRGFVRSEVAFPQLDLWPHSSTTTCMLPEQVTAMRWMQCCKHESQHRCPFVILELATATVYLEKAD